MDPQTLLTTAIVLAALAYLVGRVRAMLAGTKAACGGCGKCAAARRPHP